MNTQASWLQNRDFDTIFIFGVVALALVSGAIVVANPSSFLSVFGAPVFFAPSLSEGP